MSTMRHWVSVVCTVPVVAIVVAFVLAQSQLLRLVGTADWTQMLWPNLEWLLGALVIARLYPRDWPRWSWTALGRMVCEASMLLLLLIALLWMTGTTLTFGVWDWSAVLPLLAIAPALLAWCVAEETVLRGAAGRLSAGVRPVLQPLVLFAVAAIGTVLMQPSLSAFVVVSVCALEVLSIVGSVAGNGLMLLAARRWFVRLGIIACGIPGVGFAVRSAPLAQLSILSPILGTLLMSSLCVLWSCMVALLWTRSAMRPLPLQQNDTHGV